jgi:hypothetical protein
MTLYELHDDALFGMKLYKLHVLYIEVEEGGIERVPQVTNPLIRNQFMIKIRLKVPESEGRDIIKDYVSYKLCSDSSVGKNA